MRARHFPTQGHRRGEILLLLYILCSSVSGHSSAEPTSFRLRRVLSILYNSFTRKDGRQGTNTQASIRYHSHHRPQFCVQYVNRHASVLKCYIKDRSPPPPPTLSTVTGGWVGTFHCLAEINSIDCSTKREQSIKHRSHVPRLQSL